MASVVNNVYIEIYSLIIFILKDGGTLNFHKDSNNIHIQNSIFKNCSADAVCYFIINISETLEWIE